MMVSLINKVHMIARGPKKGQQERFVVSPRTSDGAFCLKRPEVKTNQDQDYKKVFTLSEVERLTKQGWSVRMKSDVSGDWNTLKYEGLIYA